MGHNTNKFAIYIRTCILILVMAYALAIASDASTENGLIAKVENSLLPPVLIDGEPAYNIYDRMNFYHVPGVSIAVIKDFDIAWVKNYGVRDAELGDPVTDSTLFCVGSLSKAVAAASILHLVYQGKFNLDDNVNDYLKSWKVPENEFTAQAPVTICRLLNHSGGMMFSPPYVFAPDDMPTLIQFLNAEPPLDIHPAVIDYVPGTAFQYSNAGFSALQILAEDVSGMKYPDFARKVIFDPLGMKYSAFEQPLSHEKELYAAAGHKSSGKVQEEKRYAYPSLTSGGLWSTAEEYARFLIEIQRTLKGESDLIMSRELARQMISPHDAKEYGLGVFLRYTDGVTYFSHIGDLRGFVAGFVAHPTDGYGAVVMTNSINGINLLEEILAGIARVYNWQTFLPETHTLYKLDNELLDEYTGRYRIGFDNVVKITKRDGRLFYSTPEVPELRLYPVSKDTLIAKERLGQIVFIANDEGHYTKSKPYFADNIGRLPAEADEAIKMDENDKTPIEFLLDGQADTAFQLYKEHRSAFPDDPDISERRFDYLGYLLMNQNRFDAALAVFKMNIALYPSSGNCYDSYGEGLVNAGKKEEALINYQKAYKLDPSNKNAANWINKLESDL